jgi:hypothetical protein
MKPIALVTSQYPPQVGGVGHSAARVARLLARDGRDVHVIAFQKHTESLPLDDAITSSREGDVLVHRVLVHHPTGCSEAETLTRSNREMFQALDRLTRRYGYGVLHGFFLYPAAYIAGIVGRMHGTGSSPRSAATTWGSTRSTRCDRASCARRSRTPTPSPRWRPRCSSSRTARWCRSTAAGAPS